jgi:hypothetical protein
VALLDAYSGHRVLDASTRNRLYRGIADLIAKGPRGEVRKDYLFGLLVVRRSHRS